MTFTEGAGRLAGLAGAVLGWRPHEFWRATPAELAAILDALAPPAPPMGTRAMLDRLMREDGNG